MPGALEDYWGALLGADRQAALAVVTRALDEGAAPLELVEALVVRAQARLDELWLDGRTTVVEDRTTTDLNEGLLHWLCSYTSEPGQDRPLVLVAPLAEERHTLGLQVLAEAVRVGGYRVAALDRPDADALLRAVLTLKPRALLVAATAPSSLAGCKSLLGNVRAIGIPVVAVGPAFADGGRAGALGATVHAPTPTEALDLLARLPERVRPLLPTEPTPADGEAAWIQQYRAEITPYVVRAVATRHVGDESRPLWWGVFEGLVDDVLGCLAAALEADDESLVIEARDRTTRVLTGRGADASVVQEVWELLAEALRGHPLARLHLAGAAPISGGDGDDPAPRSATPA